MWTLILLKQFNTSFVLFDNKLICSQEMEIKLRPWNYGDAERLIYICENFDRSACNLRISRPGTFTLSKARWKIERYVDLAYNDRGYACAIEVDGIVVGQIQFTMRLEQQDSSCDLELFIVPEACGKGIGQEAVKRMIHSAFNDWNLENVYASMLDVNHAAIRIAEKVGMTYYGADDSKEWTIDGKKSSTIIYRISSPKKKTQTSDVELKRCSGRDIYHIAKIFGTADYTHREVPEFLLDCILSYRKERHKEPSKEYIQGLAMSYLQEFLDSRIWIMEEYNGQHIRRVIKYNGAIVGFIAVCTQEGQHVIDGLLDFIILPEYSGKGIATKAVGLMLKEAFMLRQFSRISTWVFSNNIALQRVLEKNGFQHEGTLRNGVLSNGKPINYLVYGILRNDLITNYL